MTRADTTQTTRATLAQVAERAGVSLKTASRALGGEEHVSERTHALVMAAARELDYQRNTAASLLASGRLADSIGLITGDFTNPFYSALAQGIEDEISEHGMHLSVTNSRESSDQERRVAADLADRQVNAVITVSAAPDHRHYAALQARGIPVVFVDRPPAGIDADSVVFDNREGARVAARELRDAGHERIAFISDFAWLPTSQARLAGMGDVLDPVVPEWRELVRANAHDATAAEQITSQLLALDEPPTAIVAGNNRALLGVMQAIAGRESTPAVIGFDDPEWARVLGISVVAGDVEELGRRAAGLAVSRLGNRGRATETVVLPMSFIARSDLRRPHDA